MWILAVFGLGLGVGLGIFGLNALRTVGIKLVAVTPSRGVAIELAATIVLSCASLLRLPLSTTY